MFHVAHRTLISVTSGLALLAGLGLPTSLILAGCVEEATVTLPKDYNEFRNRSVRIDAGKLATKGGTPFDIGGFEKDPTGIKLGKLLDYTADCIGSNCSEFKKVSTDGIKATSMMGVGGTVKPVLTSDDTNPALFNQTVRQLYPSTLRIPMGYGCKAMMQGMFPDRKKDTAAIDNYDLKAMDELINVTRGVGLYPLWTVGYDIGTVGEACTYENGEVKGKPIADPKQFAKAAARIAQWYDFDLPKKSNDPKDGNPLCLSTEKITKPWFCSHTIVNVEFGRDPFGAGGYTKDTKAAWLEAYRQFALEMRAVFTVPGNDVKLIGPSVVIKSDLEVQDPTSASRSPIFDFIDFVVDPKNKPEKADRVPLSYLSMEIEASSPTEARSIVKRVSDYAAAKGLKFEKGLFGEDGTKPIPIWVTDLRIKNVPEAVARFNDPKNAAYDTWRFSSWRGGFVTSTKILWQGLVDEATIGSTIRFPTLDPATTDAVQLAITAKDSDFVWFGQEKVPSGALKPAAWPGFWFHPDHMGGEQLVAVQHGPDALGMSSKQATDPEQGIVVMATRTTCVNANKVPSDCVPNASDSPTSATFYTKGKRNILRVLVTDFQVELKGGKEVLEHKLRVQIDGLPSDAKVAGYKLAWMDGTASTWSEILYREQGFADITNGALSFTRTVPVPSVQFFELYF